MAEEKPASLKFHHGARGTRVVVFLSGMLSFGKSQRPRECSCEPVDWREKRKRKKGLTALTDILLDLYVSVSHGPALLAAVLKAVHSYLATFCPSLRPPPLSLYLFFFFFNHQFKTQQVHFYIGNNGGEGGKCAP